MLYEKTKYNYNRNNNVISREPLEKNNTFIYEHQEGRGHWAVYYTSPQSF